ncbi:conserved hypothetical protein [Uncinocarpus reesii 1704]|uniref:G-protein coupled receptors family 2 profile 2 domain-containing protein n=1 Tax=Uncinocarpus reesii (strain UAMH 1704) TaxID=336963 RepID=C4JPE8_UNCRE|nr:uncharacterized protein UREG_04530 [Uncinocarpus reesii 1704]EEP79684.1 conserved hypothetical protein [Uncinocarpus reesii 1704]
MPLRAALQLMVQQRSIDHGGIVTARRMTPMVIDPLPTPHRNGLIAIGVTSLLSAITTVGLFVFITYRLIFWRKYHSAYIGFNQYIILIYNLLIADFQEALGFLLSVQWAAQNSITHDSFVCPVQGWLLQIGDPASGIFVLAIAIHTFLIVVMGRKMSHRVFVWFVVGLWIFCLALVLVPTALYGRKTFAPSGAWCWIDENYEATRLWGHYLWIFVAEFGSIAIYSILFVYLRRQVSSSPIMARGQKEHLRRLRRVTGYMVLYPLAYIVLSLPLAAGRMAMARGEKLSIVYFCVAGAFISSSGFVDVVMYALTRRALLLDSQPSNVDRAYSSGRYQPHSSHIATVTAEHRSSRMPHYNHHHHRRQESENPGYHSSMENIIQEESGLEMLGFGMGKVYQKTTIEITSEPLEKGPESPTAASSSGPSCDSANPMDSIPSPVRAWKLK